MNNIQDSTVSEQWLSECRQGAKFQTAESAAVAAVPSFRASSSPIKHSLNIINITLMNCVSNNSLF